MCVFGFFGFTCRYIVDSKKFVLKKMIDDSSARRNNIKHQQVKPSNAALTASPRIEIIHLSEGGFFWLCIYGTMSKLLLEREVSRLENKTVNFGVEFKFPRTFTTV